jgi:hypothetical protein
MTYSAAEKGCCHGAGDNDPLSPAQNTPCQCIGDAASTLVATKMVPVDAPILNLVVGLRCESCPQHANALAGGRFVDAAVPKSQSLSIPLLLGHLLF